MNHASFLPPSVIFNLPRQNENRCLATEALGAAAVHLSKSAVYGRFAALDAETLACGLVIGLALIAGSWFGKRIVNRLDTAAFITTVEVLLGITGAAMMLGL